MMYHMKIATVRELRNQFSKIARWLEDGEAVELRRRGKPIGRIAPLPAGGVRTAGWPDFAARLRSVFGAKVTSDSQALIDEGRGPR